MISLDPPQHRTGVLEGNIFSYYWATWFRSVWSLLGYQNCRTEAFTPTTTGFPVAGTRTYDANYNIFRNRFSFSIDVNDTATITISGGATIDLKNLNNFVLRPINNGHFVVSNLTTNLTIATGVINNGIAYFPAISAVTDINISGFYLIEETK